MKTILGADSPIHVGTLFVAANKKEIIFRCYLYVHVYFLMS